MTFDLDISLAGSPSASPGRSKVKILGHSLRPLEERCS